MYGRYTCFAYFLFNKADTENSESSFNEISQALMQNEFVYQVGEIKIEKTILVN